MRDPNYCAAMYSGQTATILWFYIHIYKIHKVHENIWTSLSFYEIVLIILIVARIEKVINVDSFGRWISSCICLMRLQIFLVQDVWLSSSGHKSKENSGRGFQQSNCHKQLTCWPLPEMKDLCKGCRVHSICVSFSAGYCCY